MTLQVSLHLHDDGASKVILNLNTAVGGSSFIELLFKNEALQRWWQRRRRRLLLKLRSRRREGDEESNPQAERS